MTKATAAILFDLHRSRPRPPTNRARLRLLKLRCEADTHCLPVWPALTGAARHQQRLRPPSSLLRTGATRDHRPKCLSVWPARAGAARQHRLPPPSYLLCSGADSDHRPIILSRLIAPLRCEANAKCLSCYQTNGLLANTGCRHSPLCFAPMPSRTFDQSSMLWLLFGARQNLMPTVCMFGKHSQGLLANRGCCHLTLSFAPEPAATSDQL